MDDRRIVDLYWDRDETAITETENKYGRFCFSIANRILQNAEDARECVNDTFLAAWNAIPPHRPEILSTFLGKITRRLSLKKRRDSSAEKRGGGNSDVSLDELEECIPSGHSIDDSIDIAELTDIINTFLSELPLAERRVFLRRYWYFDSIGEIASRFGFSHSKVKMMLKRTRDKLLVRLQKGYLDMRSEKLQDAIGEVRDDFILDADIVIKKKKSHWLLWAAAAACLCLITVVAVKLLRSPAAVTPQQWSASINPAEYFKNSKNGNDGKKGSSSASLVMLPYAVSVPLHDERENLEAEGVLPAMPDRPQHLFWADYHSDGSLYKVVFYWGRRAGDEYSDLRITASPKELHEISDVITVRVDENGNPLPADVTVTERDGVRIIAEGGEEEEKTLTWQTDDGWYQIGGSWNDRFEHVDRLRDPTGCVL